MGARYAVTGPAVVLRTKSGSERYLYRDAPFDADEFVDDSVKRAVKNGLVEKLTDAVSLPEGEPTDKWSVPQLELLAEQKGIDLASASTKPEKLAAILEALKK